MSSGTEIHEYISLSLMNSVVMCVGVCVTYVRSLSIRLSVFCCVTCRNGSSCCCSSWSPRTFSSKVLVRTYKEENSTSMFSTEILDKTAEELMGKMCVEMVEYIIYRAIDNHD